MFCLIWNRGTDELLGVMDRVHIVNSTLGKALGGAAGTYLSDVHLKQRRAFRPPYRYTTVPDI